MFNTISIISAQENELLKCYTAPLDQKKYLINNIDGAVFEDLSIDGSETRDAINSYKSWSKSLKSERSELEKELKNRKFKLKFRANTVTDVVSKIDKIGVFSLLANRGKDILLEWSDRKYNEDVSEVRNNFKKSARDWLNLYVIKQGRSTDINVDNVVDFIKANDESLSDEEWAAFEPAINKLYGKAIKDLYLENSELSNELSNIEQQVTDLNIDVSELNLAIDLQGYQIKDLNGNIIRMDKTLLSHSNSISLIGDKLNSQIEKFVDFQELTTEKFEEVFVELGEMQSQINDNSEKIRVNEVEIRTLRDKTHKTQGQVLRLSKLVTENRVLISQNSYRLDVASDVMFNNVNTSSRIQLIESGMMDNLFSDSEKQEELSRLKKFEFIENFNDAIALGGEAVELAQNLGVPPEDLKDVSEILEIAGVVSSVSFAIMAPNPMSIMSAANGVLGLGKGSSSEPDPMLEAIFQQLSIINQKLDIINTKVDILNTKLNELMEFEYEAYKRTMQQFEYLDGRIQIIDKDLKYLTAVLTSECAIVDPDGTFNDILAEVENSNSLGELLELHESSGTLQRILDCVFDFVSTSNVASNEYIHFNRKDPNNINQNIIYNPSLNLAQILKDHKNDGKVLEALTIAVEGTEINNEVVNSIGHTTYNWAFDNMHIFIDPYNLLNLISTFEILKPFYYYGAPQNSFKPLTVSELTRRSLDLRTKELRGYFQNLIKLLDISIVQQNMISGEYLLANTYRIVKESESLSDDMSSLLSGNYYFKTNLATHIINEQFHFNTSMYKSLSSIMNNVINDELSVQEEISWLNGQMNDDKFNFVVVNASNGQGSRVELELKFDNGNNDVDIYVLPLTDFVSIVEGYLIRPNSLSHLIETRKRLESSVFEYNMALDYSREDHEAFQKILLTQIYDKR